MIYFGLKHSNSPKAREAGKERDKLPIGSKVLVFRDAAKAWTGPFLLIDLQGETVVVQIPRGRRIFRTTRVRPWRLSILKIPSLAEKEEEGPNGFEGNFVIHDPPLDCDLHKLAETGTFSPLNLTKLSDGMKKRFVCS